MCPHKVWEVGLELGCGTVDAISTLELNPQLISDGDIKLGQEFGFHLCGAMHLSNTCLSCKQHVSESNRSHVFCTGGATKLRTGLNGSPLRIL